MPHSTRSELTSNNTTMSDPSINSYTIEPDPERLRLIGLITNDDDHPLTNGHLTNGYHSSDETSTAEEVQMRSPAPIVAPSSLHEPSINITTTGAGAGTGGGAVTGTQTYITGTTINGTHISDITINGTNITGTTITGTRISGVTINGTNITGTTINGVSANGSGATVNGTNNNIDPTLIQRAPPPLDEQEAEAAFAATVASVITSNANERTAVTVNERTGSISLDNPGVIKVYPRALFDINPTKLGDFLRREFGDPWVRDPPVWGIEALHDGSFKVTAPRALTDAEIRSCEGF